jgi:DNA polymerase
VTTFVDTETRCPIDINRGTDLYTAQAECMLTSFVRDEGKAVLWDVLGGESIPPDLADAIRDPAEPLVAHNATFDRAVFTRCLHLDIPVSRWRCTMAQAYAHGLPGSLAALCAVLDLAEDQRKQEEDGKLIHLFCIPYADGTYADRRSHPEEWVRFCNYALMDAVALREIHRRLPKHNYRDLNLESWQLDQLINERGFGFDPKLASAARKALSYAKDAHDTDILVATEGEVASATQRAKLLAYLNASGLALPNMRASTMREWLERDDVLPEQRFILELRLEAAKSSGSKFKRGMEMVGEGSRIRHAIQWSGAGRTGRSAGRGFQPHNAPRPTAKAAWVSSLIIPEILSGEVVGREPLVYGGVNEACSNAVRGCIVAAPGNELVVSDWSNIEGRGLAWCSGEEWKLDAYRAQDSGSGADGYRLLYSRFFGAPLDEVTEDQRQVGKVVDLSCGYLASVGAFVTMAAGYKVDLDSLVPIVLPIAKQEHRRKAYTAWKRAFLDGEDLGIAPDTYQACHVLVQVYREANAKIFSTGHAVGNACIEAVENPGAIFEAAHCRIWSTGGWLIIELPSGRRLLYSKPRIETEKKVDPLTEKERLLKHITYIAWRGKQWMRNRAWAGLFIENIVQAIANDILRLGLKVAHQNTREIARSMGVKTAICLHVHDEIVLDVPKGAYALDQLRADMTTGVLAIAPWAKGFPLAAAGYVAQRYKKG